MPSNVNNSIHFEWMFLELIQIRDECMVRVGGKSKQYGAELQEMINLKRFFFFFSQWSVDGTTVVETDESRMEFAPLPLEKQIKGVNQNWLNWLLTLFQLVITICIKTYHQQQISVAPLSIFTTRSIAEKGITGNEKNFWNCFVCSGDLGGSKYLLSQMTKKEQQQQTKNNWSS